MSREEELASAFVVLAELLTGSYEIQEVIDELVDRSASLVGAAAAGVMMVDDAGELRISAASTRDMAQLEVLEMQREEGPCYDAFRSCEQQHDEDLRGVDARRRWPRFAPRAVELGFRSAYAFPLRVQDDRIGALNVFLDHTGPFARADLHALQAMADVAAIGVARQHHTSRRRVAHQQAVVELSRVALGAIPLADVYDQVCATVADLLSAPMVQVHELDPAGQLVPRVSAGWEGPLEPLDPASPSPISLAAREQGPVVVDDLTDDGPLRDSTLERHGVVSGVSVVIPGEPRPFGVFSAYCRERRSFDREDLTFVDSVAALLGSVIARHQTEAQLRRAQRHEAVGRLVTGIVHDFNNLLAVVGGNAQLLAMDVTDPAVDSILAATEQGRQQCNRLLAFSRQQEPRLTRVNVNEIVRATTAMVDKTICPALVLEVELDDGLPDVAADRSQLDQAVLNLVLNARDAMPDGGTLTIRTVEGPGDAPSQRHVRLIVSDTGIGMPDEVLARAFDPYYTTKTDGGGTGLGLATVYSAVTSAGGSIDVDTELGRGTTFAIDLPVADPDPDVDTPTS